MSAWGTDRTPDLASGTMERPVKTSSLERRLNNSKSPDLDRNQALTLLLECRALALNLAEQGMDLEIKSPQDRAILKGFEAVWLSGWLEDLTLQSEAGLSPAHIATLGYLLAQQQSHSNTNM